MTRHISPELDKVLGKEFNVLDHGFIRVIDYMGNDSAIVQSARVSYGKGTKHLSQDAALINYLMRNSHTSPFEMCEIKLHIKLPIFVARQWVRHRTANINEYSARYSLVEDQFYTPSNICLQSKENKQARGNEVDDHKYIQNLRKEFQDENESSYKLYSKRLEDGIAREISRVNLPLSCYTEWYWKIDLHNLLHFLKLRCHAHAQYEIREYADEILNLVKLWVPLTYSAFADYILNSYSISKKGLEAIKKILKQEKVSKEEIGMNSREWAELMNAFDINQD